ncbi:MAG: nitrilase-related carbon-nitrogen hydrolase [Thermoleophilia bacterium]
MTRELTLALAQVEPQLGAITANLDLVMRVTAEAAGKNADWVIFPELCLTGCNPELLGDRLIELALGADDEPMQQLARAAGQHGVYLVVGFIEKRAIPGVVYNSLAIFGPQGSLLRTYAKSHLFMNETLHFRRGPEVDTVRVDHGVIGPMICMDIGYPEVARILSLRGAELLLASAGWIVEDEDLWELSLRARALDNLAFVAGVNLVGVEGNMHFIGQSMVVDPRGRVLAKMGGEEGLLIATVDLDQVALARRRALHLTGRRPELYGPLTEMT